MRLIFYSVLLAFSLAVGALRYWKMGDIYWETKLGESAVWAAAAFVGAFAFLKSLLIAVAPGGAETWKKPTGRNLSESEVRAVTPEELATHEEEVPEMERPQVEGIKGRPPSELADVIRNLSEDENR